MGTIDISGIDKAEILKCLMNDACITLGWFFPYGNRYLNYEECVDMLNQNETKFFDFYKGKSLYINLNGQTLYTSKYDEINGDNACYNSIKHLLLTKSKQNGTQTKN